MADTDYTKVCSIDGCTGPVQAKGMCPKHYHRQLRHGYFGQHKLTCKQCGSEFQSDRMRIYCSDSCNYTAHLRRKGVKPRDVFNAQNRPKQYFFNCEWCGKYSFRSPSGSNLKAGLKNRWCSMACRKAQAAAIRPAPSSRVEFLPCKGCGSLFCQRYAWDLYCTPKCKKDSLSLRQRRPCGTCGSVFMPECSGGRASLFCSEQCRESSPTRKKCKRVAGARRRARLKALPHESIDPLKVFERDSWRCRLCGVSTPQRLRGTIERNAPELDHIIPLSKGGGHLWTNVQCACRSCNQAKSDKPLGQLLLVA